jgi:hypothetical protein
VSLSRNRKKPPTGIGGHKAITMNTRYIDRTPSGNFHTSRMFALSDPKYRPRAIASTLHRRVLVLCALNSGERFSQIGTNAVRAAKAMIEDRFHRVP